MPKTSTLINLGSHAVEITDTGILIAAHPQSATDPLVEAVQLSEDEALKLLSVLRARYPLASDGDDDYADTFVPRRMEHGDQ